MKQCFEDKNFRQPTLDLINQANKIIEEYTRAGYTLTLRQLYYQFVARDLIPNKQSEYKRLGSVVNDGRMAGLIDWDAIEDRTRNLSKPPAWETPEQIINAVAEQYREDLWEDQPYYVEVWVEKEALAGVIERACRPLRVPYFSCRGYVSQSEQHGAGRRLLDRVHARKRVKVFHLGDFDPSGIDMTRDNRDRLRLFGSPEIVVERIALNRPQIDEFEPPPNPAKETDARFASFQEQHGDESYELDALDPKVLDNLITDHVSRCINADLWDAAKAREDRNRKLLSKASENWEDVTMMLEDIG